MKRIFLALFPCLWMVACDRHDACAFGPTEIKDVEIQVVIGEPIDEFIAFPESAVGDFTVFSADDAPTSVSIELSDTGLNITGSTNALGTQTFSILVEAEEDDVCAPWARYDIALIGLEGDFGA